MSDWGKYKPQQQLNLHSFMTDKSLTLHLREIQSLKQRLRTVEVTLAVVLSYLVLDLAVRVIR